MIFISLDYSPWSEKARWALDHSGLKYKNKAYISMLGAPWLRLKTKKFTGPVTVPVLLNDENTLSDSFDIARYADKNRDSNSSSLFRDLKKAKEWNELSEIALSIGRYHCVVNQLGNTEAQKEILPSFIPLSIKPYFTWLTKNGLNYHLQKYQVEENSLEVYRNILLKLRKSLSNSEYILDEFSYCDIVMALALQYLKPVDHQYSAPGPAAAMCWTNQKLVEEFPDLIKWRDEVYRKHR